MSFGERLREERKRLGYKQAEFAARVGTDVPKQSLRENDRRGLRAPYLARIAEVGVDVLYVLTGRRSEACLDEAATAFLAGYFELPPELRQAVERLMADLGKLADGAEPRPQPDRNQ
ncbi:MAG TPA: helix-turn-helix transcriptional regulator [Allosphingosinicella sp.]|nr:helix-turn-helix transcriptional regulator [Allosphingosinicella sp.]